MSNVISVKFQKKKKKYRPRARPAKVSCHFRFDQEVVASLTELAQKNKLSVSEYVRCVVECAVNERSQYHSE